MSSEWKHNPILIIKANHQAMTFPANRSSGKMAAQWKCHRSQWAVIFNYHAQSYGDSCEISVKVSPVQWPAVLLNTFNAEGLYHWAWLDNSCADVDFCSVKHFCCWKDEPCQTMACVFHRSVPPTAWSVLRVFRLGKDMRDKRWASVDGPALPSVNCPWGLCGHKLILGGTWQLDSTLLGVMVSAKNNTINDTEAIERLQVKG